MSTSYHRIVVHRNEADDTSETQRRIARHQAEIERLAAIGEDPFEDGCIITWDRSFVGEPRTFTYVAIRCAGRWFTTGVHEEPMSWIELNEKHLQVEGVEVYAVKTLELVA